MTFAVAPAQSGAPAAEITYEPAPQGTPADAPRVFAAINGVMRDAMPVGKDQTNTHQGYKFRGIDDVMSAMAGPMRSHGVFILPNIAGQKQERDGKVTRTLIKMRYRIYGPAGDCLVADIPGEAFDTADKSTNKAQAAALKYLLFTLFMLPVDSRSIDDGDRDHPTEPTAEHRAERAQQRQNKQQRQQQPRRSNQAEPGPWENEQPKPPKPSAARDYRAEARKANSPEAFAKVRAAAVAAGAPAPYVAELDAIAREKRAAAERQKAPTQGPNEAALAERAQALGEMYDAATAAGLTDKAEADQTFSNRHGHAHAAGTLAEIRETRDDLLDAARAAGAIQ